MLTIILKMFFYDDSGNLFRLDGQSNFDPHHQTDVYEQKLFFSTWDSGMGRDFIPIPGKPVSKRSSLDRRGIMEKHTGTRPSCSDRSNCSELDTKISPIILLLQERQA